MATKSKSKTKSKKQTYQEIFLAPPLVACVSYIMVFIVALAKQNVDGKYISFSFLQFWGVILLLVLALVSLFGYVKNKSIRQGLFLLNGAVALVVLSLSVSLLSILYKADPSNYSCNDSIRCVITTSPRE
ncbi:MAG TPA: hypothetical protein VMR34_04455 [Candidatus Saccharimonadales bacterium]|nr:hypothetical protein [Candidatus Saccharimonadales bacterium]